MGGLFCPKRGGFDEIGDREADLLSVGHELLINGVIELRCTRQNPKIVAVRGADHGYGVVGVEFEDPVITFPGWANEPREEIVEGHHQFGIAGTIDDRCNAVGLVHSPTGGETFVVHIYRAILPDRIRCF